ncbi:MAG TPA: hypothetical protein VMY37_40460 [Thermoguttaceae bacterium]|nr:hypothetical protein [Thermoguttaceae bacterium]
MSDLRLAVVAWQLLGEEEVFLDGRLVGIGIVVVEGVHGERPIDDDRIFVVFREEHDPAAEASHARLARLPQHGIGPRVDHTGGRFRLGLRPGPRHGLAKIELATAGPGQQH